MEFQEMEMKKRKIGKQRLLGRLPTVLGDYVWDFFRGDFKTWSSILQTCSDACKRYVDDLEKLRVLWTEVESIGGIHQHVKKQIYDSYFYTNMSYSCIGGARLSAQRHDCHVALDAKHFSSVPQPQSDLSTPI